MVVHEAMRHEAYFSRLLDRFPQNLVLPVTAKEEEESAAARYYKVRCLLVRSFVRPFVRSFGSVAAALSFLMSHAGRDD